VKSDTTEVPKVAKSAAKSEGTNPKIPSFGEKKNKAMSVEEVKEISKAVLAQYIFDNLEIDDEPIVNTYVKAVPNGTENANGPDALDIGFYNLLTGNRDRAF
jgi:hypothetical protein